MKHILLSLVIALIANQCKKKEAYYISKSEISQLTNDNISKVLERKAFDVSSIVGIEDIIIYTTSTDKMVRAVFSKKNDQYSLIAKMELGEKTKLLKVSFINPALEKSLILTVIQNKERSFLHLSQADKFIQMFDFSNNLLEKVSIGKFSKFPKDEYIKIDDARFRYDGLSFQENFDDTPLFYLSKIIQNKEQSKILIVNRGGFTGRAVITLSFPDLGRNYKTHLREIEKFRHVTLYRPGKRVFRSGGGFISLKHPIIEIIKEPFGHLNKIQLPLFMDASVQTLNLRAVYKYRGSVYNWPDKSNVKSIKAVKIEKDQQQYFSYKIKLNSRR